MKKEEKKISESDWLKAIEKAKGLYDKRQEIQMTVAALAVSVCEISWGGRVKEGTYTLKRFAEEIPMTPKTLGNWVVVYKNVYAKLTEKQQRQTSYTVLLRLASLTKREDSADKVRKIADRYFTHDSFDIKIIKYLRELRSLHHNFLRQSAAYRCEKETLEEIFLYANGIVKILLDYKKDIKGKDTGRAYKIRRFHSAARSFGVPRVRKEIRAMVSP